MPRLPDGTIVPSIFQTSSASGFRETSGKQAFALKIGRITKIYYPDDPMNLRKDQIEYEVTIEEKSGQGGYNMSVYKNCVVADLFGGIGDFFEYTYRTPQEITNNNPFLTDGSSVLLLCLHADTMLGYIVGGAKHKVRKSKTTKARGVFLEFEFNGVNIEINKDGELTLTYKSLTNNLGVPQSADTGGSFIKIDKTGSIEFNDNKATSIRLDKPTSDITITTTKHKIIVNAKDNVEVTTQAKAMVTATGNVEVVTKAKALVTATGNVEVTTQGDALVTASGKAKVKAPLVELTNSSTAGNDGVINGTSIDPFTGVPHIDFSAIVRAKK